MIALRHHVLTSESPWQIALKSIHTIRCLKRDFMASRAEPWRTTSHFHKPVCEEKDEEIRNCRGNVPSLVRWLSGGG